MIENENFQFFGFPENIEIEIPDEPSTSSKFNDPRQFMKDMSTMDPESLKKMLPKEAIKELESVSKMAGMSLEDMLESAVETAKNMMNNDMSGLFAMLSNLDQDQCDCEDCDEGDEEYEEKYELGDISYLKSEYFGSIKCIEDEDLYTHFIDRYGNDSTKYLDPNLGIKDSYLTELTAKLPLGNVTNLKYVNSNKRFILYYAETDIPETYGFFVAVIKTEKDFALYIPEYQNTFKVDGEKNVSLYNPEEDEEFFTTDSNGCATFNNLSISAIQFSVNFVLAPIKRTLLTPHQFGTIKNTMPSIMSDASMIKVGNITANDSPEATLLRKDAELDMRESTYPLYFNFGRVVPQYTLLAIAPIIFKSDLNECPLMSCSELKFTSDGRLYIDVDLGDF